MRGKTVIVTGFTAGVGRAASVELAKMGADLVLVCRDRSKGEETIEHIRHETGSHALAVCVGDLGSQDDIRRIAAEFLAMGKPLHVLFNNAGLVMQRRASTVDGLETTFAVNHLAYFMLTHLLTERLRESAPARVVCTASDAHKFSGRELDFADLQSERSYSMFSAYGKSKLANILFTRELARREAESGVSAYSFHPGFVGSSLGKNNGWFARTVTSLISPFARSSEKGADTGVYLCSSPDLADASGGYFYNRKQITPSKLARNDDVARRLWSVSAKLTGLPES